MSAVRAPADYAAEVRSEMTRRLASSGRQNAGILRDQMDRGGKGGLYPAAICLGAIDCMGPRNGGALSSAAAIGFLSLSFAALTSVALAADTAAAPADPPGLWLTLNAADGLFSLAHTTLLDAANDGGWSPERTGEALAALDVAGLAAAEATGVELAAQPSGQPAALKAGTVSPGDTSLLEAAGRVAGIAAGIGGGESLASLAAWARALPTAASVAEAIPGGLPSPAGDADIRYAIEGVRGASLPRQSEEALIRFAEAVVKEGL